MIRTLFVLAALVGTQVWAEGSGSATGPAHSSIKYCRDHGGIDSNTDESGFGGGQGGICRFSDNGIINTMTFWRYGTSKRQSQAIEAFLKARWHAEEGGIETWARQNCEQVGGTVREYREHLRPSISVTLCQFEDYSSIEAWTLFAGPNYYKQLARLLTQTN